jgi:hypothetical protein
MRLTPRSEVREPRPARRAEIMPPLTGGQIHQHVGQGRARAEPLDQPGEGIAPGSAVARALDPHDGAGRHCHTNLFLLVITHLCAGA